MPKPRTQKEIIDSISKELKLTMRDGRRFFERIIEEFSEELLRHQRMEIAGLGVFGVQVRPEHTTTHPTTKEPVTVPMRKSVRYRSAQKLRRRLNPG